MASNNLSTEYSRGLSIKTIPMEEKLQPALLIFLEHTVSVNAVFIEKFHCIKDGRLECYD